jgi:hypothetical protein
MAPAAAAKATFDSPLLELETILDRLEWTIDNAVHTTYQEAVREKRKQAVAAAKKAEAEQAKTDGNASSSASSSFFQSWRLRTNKVKKSGLAIDPLASDSGRSPLRSGGRAKRPLPATFGTAAYMPKLPVEEIVEDLRRLAELVVVGENYVTSQEKKGARTQARRTKRWNVDRDSIDGVVSTEDSDDDDNVDKPSPEWADLFDLFFERNALGTMVDLLTGASFDLVDHVDHLRQLQVWKGGNDDDPENVDPACAILDLPEAEQEQVWLPPLAISLQALQSISIFIQNVSRATSLYIILSNDHLNTLIDLSLDRYAAAESTRRQAESGSDDQQQQGVFASPEMTELTTHFVTLLKSLALRMNAETLQFFLQYPKEGETGVPISSPHYSPKRGTNGSMDNGDDADEHAKEAAAAEQQGTQEALQVSFPLYQRALDFCAAHQESFVRVTAMNICLNTLRLTTIEPTVVEASSDLEEEEGAFGTTAESSVQPQRSLSSPDGALHTAQALPFRERLAIARHTCIPSRVERLIAPIFTKLSERWTALDEAIREIDEHTGQARENEGPFEKVAKAKEEVRRKRLVRTFLDRAADMQDELLLLEDVFKVGLTVLNEQLIEMMLATFIYPMITQPLLNFYQRYTSKMDESRISNAQNPFGRHGADCGDLALSLAPFSGPAKTSLFTIANVFESLSNPALLRLLYTALFHPLSPDATSVPTVRSNLVVSAVDDKGNATIRLDSLRNNEGLIPNDRSTYLFGTTPNNRRLSRTKGPDLALLEDKEVCVFVLAPALAEVLEFDGHDMGLVARTRTNSYRVAFLQCFDVPHDFSEVRSLAACAMDAAVSCFEAKFAADIMLGTDLKTFTDDIPADERNLDSEQVHLDDDRGIGGSPIYESRHSVGQKRGGKVGTDLTAEFVGAMAKGTMYASRDLHKDWTLGFDDVAGHAILCIGKGSSRALVQISKVLENRWRQAGAFIAERPGSMNSSTPMGSSSALFPPGAPSASAPDYEEQLFGSIMHTVLFDRLGETGEPVVEQFLQLRTTEPETREGFLVPISKVNDFDVVCKRVGALLMQGIETDGEETEPNMSESRGSAFALMQLDALLSLLKDLAVSGGFAIRDVPLAGMALSSTGKFVPTTDYKISKQMYAPLSSSLMEVIVDPQSQSCLPAAGSVLSLAGKKAIPCVCEAPASAARLFTDVTTGVEAEGVTWQSLYLVFDGDLLIFAQPLPNGPGGDGRIVVACYADRIHAEPDTAANLTSPARRVFLSHTTWENITPPGLFLFDEDDDDDDKEGPPTPARVGPFCRVQPYVTKLDVWFEHQKAADMAYKILSTQLFQSRAHRGRRIQAHLDPRGQYLDAE